MWRDRANSGESGSSDQPKPARIRIDVPIGTSYLEIQASIFHQAWQLAGTQLRAAIALGITPDTISRVLRRCDRLGIGCPKAPEAWPLVAVNRVTGRSGDRLNNGKNPSSDQAISGGQIDRLIDSENKKPDQAISDDRADNGENQSSVALPPSEDEGSGPSSTPGDDPERNDL